jgi:hypothetical protein
MRGTEQRLTFDGVPQARAQSEGVQMRAQLGEGSE